MDEKEERMHGGTLRALQMAGKKAPGKHPVGRARIGSKDTGSLSLLVTHWDPREVLILKKWSANRRLLPAPGE